MKWLEMTSHWNEKWKFDAEWNKIQVSFRQLDWVATVDTAFTSRDISSWIKCDESLLTTFLQRTEIFDRLRDDQQSERFVLDSVVLRCVLSYYFWDYTRKVEKQVTFLLPDIVIVIFLEVHPSRDALVFVLGFLIAHQWDTSWLRYLRR